MTAHREGREEPAYQSCWVGGVLDEAQHPCQPHGNRPAEVEESLDFVVHQDRLWLVHISDHGTGTSVTSKHRLGERDGDGVGVDVGHQCVRVGSGSDLVRPAGCQTRSDVEELPNPGLHAVADGSMQEAPVRSGGLHYARSNGADAACQPPVGLEVVETAEQAVLHARRAGPIQRRGSDPRQEARGGGARRFHATLPVG
jgi:hypothetical protein